MGAVQTLRTKSSPPPRSPARIVLATEIERLDAAERDLKVADDIGTRISASVHAGEQAVADAEEAITAARASAAEAIASPTPTGSSDLRAARRRKQDAEDDLELGREALKVAERRKTAAEVPVNEARVRVRAAATHVIAGEVDRLVTEAASVPPTSSGAGRRSGHSRPPSCGASASFDSATMITGLVASFRTTP